MTAALTHPVTGATATLQPVTLMYPAVTSVLAMSATQQQAAANAKAAQLVAVQQQEVDAQSALATAQDADTAATVAAAAAADTGVLATVGPWLWVAGAGVAVVMIIAGIVLTHPKKPPLSGHRRRRRSRR